MAVYSQRLQRVVGFTPADVKRLSGWHSTSEVGARCGLSRQGVHHLVFNTDTFTADDVRYVETLAERAARREYLVRADAVDAYVKENDLPGEAGYQRLLKTAQKATKAKKAAARRASRE